MLVQHADEIKNRRIGWVVTIFLHVLLLLFLWLYKAWPFNPPIEALYGIQVNYGTSDVGSGDQQNPSSPEAAATESQEESEENPNETPTEEQETESFETETPINTETKQNPKTEQTTTTQNTTNNTNQNNSQDTQNSNQDNNNGNDKDKNGDKGSKDGQINQSDIYTGKSGEGGSSYNMTGWKWDLPPKPKDISKETGKIVFHIKIDEDGEIVRVTIVEKTVSSEVARIYQAEVEKLTFSPTSDNPNPAPFSEGTVTFIIRSN